MCPNEYLLSLSPLGGFKSILKSLLTRMVAVLSQILFNAMHRCIIFCSVIYQNSQPDMQFNLYNVNCMQ
jgi:hypothetical protein